MLAYWALLVHLGRPLVSQTDYSQDREGDFYGSILNHITVGRHVRGAPMQLPCFLLGDASGPMSGLIS